MAEDYSYLGAGKFKVREYGSAAPFVEVGNCSALNLSPQIEEKSLPNYTEPGGGTQNSVERVTGVDISYTFHDFSPDNFARSLRGVATVAVAGSVAAEAVVAYKGGATPLARIPSEITSVETAGGGVAYTEGDDYEFSPEGIYIPAGSAIPDPIAGAPNIEVAYDYLAQTTVEAMVNSSKQYEGIFVGLNEARSGAPVVVRVHKFSGGLLQQMSLIGEDYGAGEVNGKVLLDGTKTGVGISKYFKATLVG
jgi:hypothetical protein